MVVERAYELFAERRGIGAEAMRVAELERLVGQQARELAVLKKRLEPAPCAVAERRAMIAALHAETPPGPAVHHSDQGVQYVARGYVGALEAAGVQVSIADGGKPTQNAVAERFMRTEGGRGRAARLA